jgi:hypothetical protein
MQTSQVVIDSWKVATYEAMKREGKIIPIDKGQMNEAFGIFIDLYYEQAQLGSDFETMILKHGERRHAERIAARRVDVIASNDHAARQPADASAP